MNTTGHSLRVLYSTVRNGTFSFEESSATERSSPDDVDEEEIRGVFPGQGWVGMIFFCCRDCLGMLLCCLHYGPVDLGACLDSMQPTQRTKDVHVPLTKTTVCALMFLTCAGPFFALGGFALSMLVVMAVCIWQVCRDTARRRNSTFFANSLKIWTLPVPCTLVGVMRTLGTSMRHHLACALRGLCHNSVNQTQCRIQPRSRTTYEFFTRMDEHFPHCRNR